MSSQNTLHVLARKLPDLIGKFDAAYQDIEKRMAKLKKAGLIYATEHWRERKYFYLLYPTKAGEARRREYVGTDPEKIAAKKEAILRANQYEALKRQLAELERVRRDMHYKLTDAVGTLARKW